MIVAVAGSKEGLRGLIPGKFADSEVIYIIETDPIQVLSTLSEGDTVDKTIDFTRYVLEWDCEAILCGEIEKEPFKILADEGNTTRYNASGFSVIEAIKKMLCYELSLIKEYLGGKGCPGEGKNYYEEAEKLRNLLQ